MGLQAGANAPYAPPAAVIEVISRYRARGLATPITTDVVERAGVSATLSRRTIHTLKLLEFIDSDGMPTEQFETMSRAPEADYKPLLGEHLVGIYAEVHAFADPATDPYERIRDAFRGFDPKGQQERMITLYLGLMEFAGQNVSAATSSRRRAEPAGAKAKPESGAKPTTKGKGAAKGKPLAAGGRGTGSGAGADGGADSDGLPPGLLGLLHQIPRGGASWSKGRRDNFLAAFTAVLDFSVPIGTDEPTTQEPDP